MGVLNIRLLYDMNTVGSSLGPAFGSKLPINPHGEQRFTEPRRLRLGKCAKYWNTMIQLRMGNLLHKCCGTERGPFYISLHDISNLGTPLLCICEEPATLLIVAAIFYGRIEICDCFPFK